MHADDLEKKAKEFKNMFPKWKDQIRSYEPELRAIAADIDAFHKKATIANIAGSSIGILGGALTVAGLIAAPFTMGGSLLLAGVGVGAGIGGGVTNITASAMDASTQKEKQNKVNKILEQYKKDSKEIADCYKKLLGAVQGYKSLGKGFENEQLFNAAEILVKSSAAFVAVGKAMTKQTLRTFRAVSGVLSVLFIAWDVYSIVKDVDELNEGAKTDVGKQIRVVAEMMEEGLNEYEKAYGIL